MAARRRGKLTRAEVEAIFAAFEHANPEPRGELEYTNPFTLLVAVVLSAQATDAGVNKATLSLFALADTPQKMMALGEERIRDLFREGVEGSELRTDLDVATAALLFLSAANWAYTWLRPSSSTDGLADRLYAALLDGMRGYATP